MHPPVEPWRQVASAASSAPAAASDAPPSAGGTGAETGAFAEASAAPEKRASTGSSSESSRASLKWHPAPLWHKWYLRQKKAQRRTDEAMKALPPLKRMRATRLPNVPTSAQSSSAHLRHLDGVVEAASSFVSSGKTKLAEQDHTFRLLAYATVPHDVSRARVQQASSAESSITSSTVSSQQSSSMQQEGSIGTPTVAESKPDSARQILDTEKRLSFQWGSGFVSGSLSDTKQQGDVPDLIGLMCSASSNSTEAAADLAIEVDAEGMSHHKTIGLLPGKEVVGVSDKITSEAHYIHSPRNVEGRSLWWGPAQQHAHIMLRARVNATLNTCRAQWLHACCRCC